MRAKRIIATILAALSIASVSSLSASAANTADTYYTYTWSTSRYDFTPTRQKTNNTPVYLCAINNSLPYQGFYASTFYAFNSYTTASNKASASEYLVNDYNGHTIRANGTSVAQKGKYVRIRGHYACTTYSYGDCTIAWSPDTANASSYSSLN